MWRTVWWRRLRWGVVAGVMCGPLGASAQGQSELPGGVSGRVIALDTQRPVRLAQVSLQTVASAADGSAGGDGPRFGSGGSSTSARTDPEGNFLIAGVAPGDYYVTATAAGYVPVRALLQAAVSAGADPAAVLAQLPTVHVAAGETSPVVVPIERGGTISGKVQWEDGSPAAGVQVSAVAPTGNSFAFGSLGGPLQAFQTGTGSGGLSITDDRGVYRLTGLPAGSYVVRAAVQGATQMLAAGRTTTGSPVRVYAPGVFRRATAKTVELKMGEEHSDVSMTIDLRGLHTVSGSASSASAGQSVASGRVSVVDANDSELQLSGAIGPDGSFSVRYVPAGSYALKVTGASSVVATGRGRQREDPPQGVSYQTFSQAITVSDTDVTGVGVSLTPVASQP